MKKSVGSTISGDGIIHFSSYLAGGGGGKGGINNNKDFDGPILGDGCLCHLITFSSYIASTIVMMPVALERIIGYEFDEGGRM